MTHFVTPAYVREQAVNLFLLKIGINMLFLFTLKVSLKVVSPRYERK